jgi:hypothetical protein
MPLTKEESLMIYGQSIERVSVDANSEITRELIHPEDFYKMKTQNEILEKLIELGYVDVVQVKSEILYITEEDGYAFDALEIQDYTSRTVNSIIFDALVSECGKRGLVIGIFDNKIRISSLLAVEIIFYADYTRQNICEAFMKVVGNDDE